MRVCGIERFRTFLRAIKYSASGIFGSFFCGENDMLLRIENPSPVDSPLTNRKYLMAGNSFSFDNDVKKKRERMEMSVVEWNSIWWEWEVNRRHWTMESYNHRFGGWFYRAYWKICCWADIRLEMLLAALLGSNSIYIAWFALTECNPNGNNLTRWTDPDAKWKSFERINFRVMVRQTAECFVYKHNWDHLISPRMDENIGFRTVRINWTEQHNCRCRTNILSSIYPFPTVPFAAMGFHLNLSLQQR